MACEDQAVAARRLLIVMLVLLGLSTLAAALVPTRSERDGTESTGSTASEPVETFPDPLPKGEPVRAGVKVDGKTIPVVPIGLGDQLTLLVCSRRTDLLEIPDIGRVEPVSPATPAYFNLLPEEPGSYAINFVSDERLAARIEVGAKRSRARGERGRSEETGCGGRARP